MKKIIHQRTHSGIPESKLLYAFHRSQRFAFSVSIETLYLTFSEFCHIYTYRTAPGKYRHTELWMQFYQGLYQSMEELILIREIEPMVKEVELTSTYYGYGLYREYVCASSMIKMVSIGEIPKSHSGSLSTQFARHGIL
jgi:hypothetical protein